MPLPSAITSWIGVWRPFSSASARPATHGWLPTYLPPLTERDRRGRSRSRSSYFRGLQSRDLSLIPYDERVSLRAPLAPGGVNRVMQGRAALERDWWQPLQPALEGVQVKLLDVYVNETLTGVVAEAEVTITVLTPPVTLRVADRFTVNEQGRIVEQENHFDPRDVTNPGWQEAQPSA